MRTYIFPVELEHEEDGRWSAWIEALPGCAVWGYSKEEAIEALKDASQAYIEVMLEQGQTIPQEVETKDAPAVAVTIGAKPGNRYTICVTPLSANSLQP